MKNFLLGLILVVSIALSVRVYFANQSKDNAQGILNEERYQRMVAEENLQNLSLKVRQLEKKIVRKDAEIKRATKEAELLVGQLNHETKINADLKGQLGAARQQVVQQALEQTEELSF